MQPDQVIHKCFGSEMGFGRKKWTPEFEIDHYNITEVSLHNRNKNVTQIRLERTSKFIGISHSDFNLTGTELYRYKHLRPI
jgi:hypothetical protein